MRDTFTLSANSNGFYLRYVNIARFSGIYATYCKIVAIICTSVFYYIIKQYAIIIYCVYILVLIQIRLLNGCHLIGKIKPSLHLPDTLFSTFLLFP